MKIFILITIYLYFSVSVLALDVKEYKTATWEVAWVAAKVLSESDILENINIADIENLESILKESGYIDYSNIIEDFKNSELSLDDFLGDFFNKEKSYDAIKSDLENESSKEILSNIKQNTLENILNSKKSINEINNGDLIVEKDKWINKNDVKNWNTDKSNNNFIIYLPILNLFLIITFVCLYYFNSNIKKNK